MTTNPNATFTLDISPDRKKVRLQLNRALIRRVLAEKKINTMDRRKANRQVSSVCETVDCVGIHFLVNT